MNKNENKKNWKTLYLILYVFLILKYNKKKLWKDVGFLGFLFLNFKKYKENIFLNKNNNCHSHMSSAIN